MARIRVDDKLLVETNWKYDVQGIGGGIQAYDRGKEFLCGLGFRFQEASEPGGFNIKGRIDPARLSDFEEWFIRTRVEGLSDQRELDIKRELLEELKDESPLLPGLTPEDIITEYLWATKPPIETNGTQRYLEVYEVVFRRPSLHGQILDNLTGQCRFVLMNESAILDNVEMRSKPKLVSLIKGQMPELQPKE